ncbi:MAG: hypothetical protein PHO62_09030 [Sulfurimonas sp.]|uniref:hypothetical protein n=1 Tax=Sulfurimonas sp. TaxID=2022749 RepID=UPI0026317BDF|nr:hypothetical protein [Sulfurimonas sp.]MDD5373552.1 hypothetical protein [Sulfurimonas sp.]
MQLYLSNKQLAMMISPFVVASGIYFFNEDIVSNASYLFAGYNEYSNKELSQKVDMYLKIEEKYILYKDIKERVQQREKNSEWIAEKLFYPQEKIVNVTTDTKAEQIIEKVIEKEYSYKLEALYPNDKVAIINGIIVREGSTVEDAKVVEIKDNSVLLKNKKGLKWLHLFQ